MPITIPNKYNPAIINPPRFGKNALTKKEYIGSFAVFVIFYMLGTGKGFDVNYLFSHLFGGGLMLGAWFMATDYVTTPITPKGQLLYGCCLGVVTAIFRLFGGSAEGVSYAIIFCNLLVPLIEKVTKPVAFGKGGKKA